MEFKTDLFDDDEEQGREKESEIDHQPRVYFDSSEDMSAVGDESVHLVVTSPPYNVDWEYGDHDDGLDYRGEYLPMLSIIFRECHKKLVPGGRLVVNVPTLVRQGSKGGRPLAADVINILTANYSTDRARIGTGSGMTFSDYESNGIILAGNASPVTYKLREYIIWNKGFNTDGLAPNGSFPRPWGILLNNMHEGILVFQKPGERDVSSIPDDVVESSEIQKNSDDLCDDVWDIHPENWDFDDEDQSVPVFPEELPRRCIKLWTYENDTVLDPFGGRGTTCKVAKDMNRNSIMFEKRKQLEDEIKNYIGFNQPKLTSW